jgi:cytochrome P450
MQSFFWHVLSSPQTYNSIMAEMEAAIKSGQIPSSGNLSWNESQGLLYFQACLKEAMRVRPAVGVNITRLVPPEGAELEGHFFLGGTRIACNGWVLHRDRDVFGADADEFRPERWLEDVESAKRMERYMVQVSDENEKEKKKKKVKYISTEANKYSTQQFGGGSHLCIGRNLALLEINKVVPRLLRDYRFKMVHPGRELKSHASFFVVQQGLDVFVSKGDFKRSA